MASTKRKAEPPTKKSKSTKEDPDAGMLPDPSDQDGEAERRGQAIIDKFPPALVDLFTSDGTDIICIKN